MEVTRNKYRNKKTEIDGIVFDSRKEAQRYTELKMLQTSGIIKNLQMQVKFLVCPKQNGNNRARYYIADFTYEENGKKICEDVKSPITKKNPVYSLKKALVLAYYPEWTFREA